MDRRIVCMALAGAACMDVHADDLSRGWDGNIAIASEYVSRGFQQSWGEPALQGGLEYTTPTGWYAGSWVSTVSPYAIEGGRVEWDLYAGKRGTIGAVNYHGALYAYEYPGAHISASHVAYHYAEAVMGLDWRNWSLAYSLVVSRDYFGFNSLTLGQGVASHSRGSGYLELARNIDVGRGWNLTLHYGWQRINHFSEYSWQDGSAALSRSIGRFNLQFVYAKAWNKSGVYRHFTTGVPDAGGRIHISNPIAGSLYFILDYSF